MLSVADNMLMVDGMKYYGSWQKYTDRETKVLGARNIAVLIFQP